MARTSQRAMPVTLIVVAAILLVARFTYAPPEEPKAMVRWLSPERGFALAGQTRTPMLLVFVEQGSRATRQLDQRVFAAPDVARQINERFVPVRVVDRGALERRYSVRVFPTVVFTDADGNERGRMEGFRRREDLERVMDGLR